MRVATGFAVSLLFTGSAIAQTPDGHPDLSGTWSYAISLPPGSLKKEVDGKVDVVTFDRSASKPTTTAVRGALPFTDAPEYKPELRAKVKDLFDHESKMDPVFYCAKPGVPRVGPPRRIIALASELIFLYEDVSGDPYRIIRLNDQHRSNANPSAYGDAVARWDGQTLVVDVTSFTADTWFGEGGYFHTDALEVTERFWKDGSNLVWQATVNDANVLVRPWTMPPRVVKPSSEPLEESPQCKEQDADKLLNDDHHGQR
jgi:hypothetical protein